MKNYFIEPNPMIPVGKLDEIYCGPKKIYGYRKASKILNIKNLGRNKLFKFLRKKHILDEFNKPTYYFRDNDLFLNSDNFDKTPLITSYGIQYLKIMFFNK